MKKENKRYSTLVFIIAFILIIIGIAIVILYNNNKDEGKEIAEQDNSINGIYLSNNSIIKVCDVKDYIDIIFLQGEENRVRLTKLINGNKFEIKRDNLTETYEFDNNNIIVTTTNNEKEIYKKTSNYSVDQYYEEYYGPVEYSNSEYNLRFINDNNVVNMYQNESNNIYVEISDTNQKTFIYIVNLKEKQKGELVSQNPGNIVFKIEGDTLKIEGIKTKPLLNKEYKLDKRMGKEDIIKSIKKNKTND